MKKLLFLLIAMGTMQAFGQVKEGARGTETMHKKSTSPQKPGDQWMMFSRGIGVSFQNFDGLNNRISGFPQYAKLKDYAMTLNLGTLNQYKNFISGLDITGGSSMSGHRDKKSSTTRFISAAVDFGYDVIPTERILLYPFVGFGGESYQAKFFKDNSGVDFDDVAGNPITQMAIKPVSFNNGWYAWRAGFGVGIKSSKGNGIAILKAGYTGSFNNKSWKSSDNQSLRDAPSDRLGRVFVSIILGNTRGMNHMMK